MAASFILRQASDVAYWHLADERTQPSNGRYWTNSGQRVALGLNGPAANDPKADLMAEWRSAKAQVSDLLLYVAGYWRVPTLL